MKTKLPRSGKKKEVWLIRFSSGQNFLINENIAKITKYTVINYNLHSIHFLYKRIM